MCLQAELYDTHESELVHCYETTPRAMVEMLIRAGLTARDQPNFAPVVEIVCTGTYEKPPPPPPPPTPPPAEAAEEAEGEDMPEGEAAAAPEAADAAEPATDAGGSPASGLAHMRGSVIGGKGAPGVG